VSRPGEMFERPGLPPCALTYGWDGYCRRLRWDAPFRRTSSINWRSKGDSNDLRRMACVRSLLASVGHAVDLSGTPSTGLRRPMCQRDPRGSGGGALGGRFEPPGGRVGGVSTRPILEVTRTSVVARLDDMPPAGPCSSPGDQSQSRYFATTSTTRRMTPSDLDVVVRARHVELYNGTDLIPLRHARELLLRAPRLHQRIAPIAWSNLVAARLRLPAHGGPPRGGTR
jgi:hypothetical protein